MNRHVISGLVVAASIVGLITWHLTGSTPAEPNIASDSSLLVVGAHPNLQPIHQQHPDFTPPNPSPPGSIRQVAWLTPLTIESIEQEVAGVTLVWKPNQEVYLRSGIPFTVTTKESIDGLQYKIEDEEAVSSVPTTPSKRHTFARFNTGGNKAVKFLSEGTNSVEVTVFPHKSNTAIFQVNASSFSRFRKLDPIPVNRKIKFYYDSNGEIYFRFGGRNLHSTRIEALILTKQPDEEIYTIDDRRILDASPDESNDGSYSAAAHFDPTLIEGLRGTEITSKKLLFLSKGSDDVRFDDELLSLERLDPGSPPPVIKVEITDPSKSTLQDIDNVSVKTDGTTANHDIVVKQGNEVIKGALAPGSPDGTEEENVIPVGIEGTDREQLVSIEAAVYLGNSIVGQVATPTQVTLLNKLLEIEDVDFGRLGEVAGENTVSIRFSESIDLTATGLSENTTAVGDISTEFTELGITLHRVEVNTTNTPMTATHVKYVPHRRELVITYDATKFLVGKYLFEIDSAGTLVDVYGNKLKEDYVEDLGSAPGVDSANALPGRVLPGIHGPTGEYVRYMEWTPPREVPNGFNPNDKVETRVAHLYFFRDAHRVAQIINRKVQSHNRHGVSIARQQAEKSRSKADQLTVARQAAEREAIRKAQETRRLEEKLSDARRNFDQTLNRMQQEGLKLQSLQNPTDQQRQTAEGNLQAMDQAARSFNAEVQRLEGEVDSARQAEQAAHEQAQRKEAEEELARQEQFRREVAAAHADPDTYGEGVPNSPDPVEQVSISVIGEGVIHLRGPLKGVNQIRMMINQIDTPVGQVRVNVHSTQINGDEAEKLEVVSSRIQTYIDQARFLTVQSGEMLRKSVMIIAAQRAEFARGLYPGDTQHERDQRYLYAFFGKDFVDELLTIDSEFLHTGNKLLSLHSMDVTSLSSALMLLALANNSTRQMILQEFHRQMQEELPLAEQRYIEAGMYCGNGNCVLPQKPCEEETRIRRALRQFWQKHHGPPPINSLAQNSAFQSLTGFFNTTLEHDDTMTPLQREFVRLAQIFKSRLITELEYKQRVMERALIEDRLGDRVAELRDAKQKEEAAAKELADAQVEKARAIESVVVELTKTQARVRETITEAMEVRAWFDGKFTEFFNDILSADFKRDFKEFRQSSGNTMLGTTTFYGTILDSVPFRFYKLPGRTEPQVIMAPVDPNHNTIVTDTINDAFVRALAMAEALAEFDFGAATAITVTIRGKLQVAKDHAILEQRGSDNQVQLDYESLENFADLYQKLIAQSKVIIDRKDAMARDRISLLRQLKDPTARFEDYYVQWNHYRTEVSNAFRTHKQGRAIISSLEMVDKQFDQLLKVDVQSNLRQQAANEARRPLDHKKFLDMLIDELEEKYIELLEGTRAHTANIDNYIKRLTTALDDDFNTQYYYPAFRSVREAAGADDVEFGQTETTNVLANNREFAKVSPSATMEFDMPKRDILIKEGLDAAMAIYNDVGALVNDPNLMALASSQSGNSSAEIGAGSGGGFGAVRNVLPGLSSTSQEGILAQNAGTRPRHESNVEKLIPDPAIYKFETGTGFEIRPVIEPDGQAVVFDFNYMYTTNVREPVRADEKHLGRVKRHFIDTDVQLSNFELREVSRYVVALKAERTARGVPLLEDIPLIGVLWRPLPQREKSLQQNIIMAQATIFPTLFDLMGLRWAPAVADIDPLRLSNREFAVRGRHRILENRVYDVSSSRVDEFLRVPEAQRRADLYRSQSTIPSTHPNGYRGPGLDLHDSKLREGVRMQQAYPPSQFVPENSSEGSVYPPHQKPSVQAMPVEPYILEGLHPPQASPNANREQMPVPYKLPPIHGAVPAQ